MTDLHSDDARAVVKGAIREAFGDPPLLRETIREIVRKELDKVLGRSTEIAWLEFGGGCSKKALGDAVAEALHWSRVIVIDGSQLKRIAGRRTHR